MIVRKLITMISFQVNKSGLNIAASATRRIKQALGGIGGASASAGASFSHSAAMMSASASRVTSGLSQIKSSLSGIAGALGPIAGAMAAAFSVSAIKSAADDMMNLDGRLRTVTQAEQERYELEDKLYAMAQKDRQGLNSMGDLYYKVARGAQRFGVSQEDSLRVTDVVSKALTVGGASAQEASASILQLGQALGSGVLQGDELRSLDENASTLMNHIADHFGVTMGQLRQMGAQGQLTSEAVIEAILASGDAIDGEFSKMPMTIGQAQTKIKNSWDYLMLSIQRDTGVFSSIATSIDQTFEELFKDAHAFMAIWNGPKDDDAGGEQYQKLREAHPIISQAVDALKKLVGVLDELGASTGVDNLIMKILLAAGAVTAIGGVLAIVGSAVSALIGVFSGLFSIVSGVVSFLLAAGWPIVAAIAAVAAAIYFVQENWETVVQAFQPGIDMMMQGLGYLSDAWLQLQPVIAALLPILGTIAEIIGMLIVSAIKTMFEIAAWAFRGAAAFVDTFCSVLNVAYNTIVWIANGLDSIINKAKEFLGMSGELNAHNSALERMTSNAFSYSTTQNNTFNGYSAEDAGQTANYLLGGGQTQFFPYG
jgi:tape measure domain-containing protein